MNNNSEPTAMPVEPTTSLVVNERRLPQTIKRFFKNSVRELTGEILQNAQRAQAKSLRINTRGNIVTIADDGDGLRETDDSWAKLLRISDSFYDDAAVELNQKPMGLGFLSLLAHDQVLRVKISSGSRQVVIDTVRLWNEPNYWQTWTALIEPNTSFVAGLHLDIVTREGAIFTKELEEALGRSQTYLREPGVAEGYEGILEVFLNDSPVATAVPSDYRIDEKDFLFETIYEGNVVEIGIDPGNFSGKKNGVIWYGQVIPFLLKFGFHFLLKVTTGSPVNPLAPTRAGIIDDEKAAQFKAFLTEEIFRYAKSTEGKARLDLRVAKALFKTDAKRTMNELEICIIRRVLNGELEEMEDYQQLLGEAGIGIHYSNSDYEKLLTLAELREETDRAAVVLVNQMVLIEEGEAVPFGTADTGNRELSPAEYGLATFEPAVKDAFSGTAEMFFFVEGDEARADIKTVVWRPGVTDTERPLFVQPGEFALVPQNAVPEQGGVIVEIGGKKVVPGAGSAASADMFDLNEAVWHKITKPVWAYDDANNWSISSTDGLIVGVEGGRNEQANWVKTYAWTCFDRRHDEESEDTLYASFSDSITDLVIDILGDTLKRNFSFDDVCHAVYAKRDKKDADFSSVRRNIECFLPQIADGELDWKLEVRMKSGEIHLFELYL